MKEVKCEYCGASSFVNQGEFTFCSYCRAKFVTKSLYNQGHVSTRPPIISLTGSTQILLERAELYWRTGERDKAKKLYAQVLELDATNPIARSRYTIA